MSTSKSETLTRAVAILAELERVKPLYRELDELLLQLSKDPPIVPWTDALGTSWELVDNFAATNTCFRPAGVKRFELRQVKPDRERKAAA